MSETISVRIPKEELDEIEKISKFSKTTKSVVLREVLELGVKKKKLDLAIEKFRNNEITAWKASKLAGIPLTMFLDMLKEQGLEFHYSAEELEKELEDIE